MAVRAALGGIYEDNVSGKRFRKNKMRRKARGPRVITGHWVTFLSRRMVEISHNFVLMSVELPLDRRPGW